MAGEVCTLPEPLGFWVTLSLFWMCSSLLYVKQVSWESETRSRREFVLDASKQMIGFVWLWLITGTTYHCAAYWRSTLLETTVGVALEYVLLNFLHGLFNKGTGNAKAFAIGEYEEESAVNSTRIYLIQLVLWLICVTVMKLVMTLVEGTYPADSFAILDLCQGNYKIEAGFVMIFTPCVMYSFQVWITDDFLKRRGTGGVLQLCWAMLLSRNRPRSWTAEGRAVRRSEAARGSVDSMVHGVFTQRLLSDFREVTGVGGKRGSTASVASSMPVSAMPTDRDRTETGGSWYNGDGDDEEKATGAAAAASAAAAAAAAAALGTRGKGGTPRSHSSSQQSEEKAVALAVGDAVQTVKGGRLGKIVVDDGGDIPYKVAFDDGNSPTADWFNKEAVAKANTEAKTAPAPEVAESRLRSASANLVVETEDTVSPAATQTISAQAETPASQASSSQPSGSPTSPLMATLARAGSMLSSAITGSAEKEAQGAAYTTRPPPMLSSLSTQSFSSGSFLHATRSSPTGSAKPISPGQRDAYAAARQGSRTRMGGSPELQEQLRTNMPAPPEETQPEISEDVLMPLPGEEWEKLDPIEEIQRGCSAASMTYEPLSDEAVASYKAGRSRKD